MASFHDQLEKAKSINADAVSKELFDFIKSISNLLVEMNRKQIYNDSQDIHGKAIGFYSYATEIITGGSKKRGEPFDGEDTGRWLDAFYVAIHNGYFYFGSTDPKTDDILSSEHWLSKDLFGLTDENLNLAIQQEILPFIQSYYRQKLDL